MGQCPWESWLFLCFLQTCSTQGRSASLGWSFWWCSPWHELKSTSTIPTSHAPFVATLMWLPQSSSPFPVPLPWVCAPAPLTLTQGRSGGLFLCLSFPNLLLVSLCYLGKVQALVNEGSVSTLSLQTHPCGHTPLLFPTHPACLSSVASPCPCRSQVRLPKP